MAIPTCLLLAGAAENTLHPILHRIERTCHKYDRQLPRRIRQRTTTRIHINAILQSHLDLLVAIVQLGGEAEGTGTIVKSRGGAKGQFEAHIEG